MLKINLFTYDAHGINFISSKFCFNVIFKADPSLGLIKKIIKEKFQYTRQNFLHNNIIWIRKSWWRNGWRSEVEHSIDFGPLSDE